MSLGVVKNACAVRMGLPSTSSTIFASSYWESAKKTKSFFFFYINAPRLWCSHTGRKLSHIRGQWTTISRRRVAGTGSCFCLSFFCKLLSSARLCARLPILEMLKRGDSQLGHLALSCCFLISKKLESGVYTWHFPKSAIWLKVHESRHLGRHCSTACV